MRSTSLMLAAVLTAGSIAAENIRPRFYFPRHVNRQVLFPNASSPASPSDDATTTPGGGSGLPAILPSLELPGILDPTDSATAPGNGNINTTSTPTSIRVTSTPDSTPSATQTSTAGPDLGELISSILNNNETTVSSTATGQISATETEATTTSSGLALTLPTSLLPSLLPSDTTTTTEATNSATATPLPSDTGSANATSTSSEGLGITLPTLLPTLFPTTSTTSEATTTEAPTIVPTSSAAVNITSSGGLGITLPTLLPTLFPTTTDATTTEEPSVIPTSTAAVNATSSDGQGITLPTLLPTLFPTTTESSVVPTSDPVSTSNSGIDLTSLLPTVIPVPTATPITNGTESSTIVIPTESSAVVIPTGSSAVVTPTESSVIVIPTESSAVVGPTGSASESGIPPVPSTSAPATISLPATVSVSESSVPPPPTSVPGNATTSASETLPPITTPTSSVFLPPVVNTTAPVSSSDVFTPITPTTTLGSTTTLATPTFTGTSVPVTGTITDSESWLPTTILIQPSSTDMSTGGLPTGSSATSLPSNLPQALSPFNEAPQQPDGTSLIQISFLYGVNYQFLVGQPMAAAQLFQHLPEALAFAGGFDKSKSVMHSIVPYNTIPTLGYITSQALVYHPTDQIAKLQVDIRTPNSLLYNNPQAIVFNLTTEINPAIDIILGSLYGGVSGTGGNGPYPTDTGSSNNEPFSSGNSGENTSGTQKAQTAGIAVGAAAVASAYGAAMFLIARRYKRKRQGHKRNSSISSNAEMRQNGSPALMGGALLSRDFTGYGGVQGNTRHSQGSGRSGGNNSARTAIISAPVAAENSLGWN